MSTVKTPFKTQIAAVNRKVREVLKNSAAQFGKKAVPAFKSIEIQYNLNSSRALGTCRSYGGRHVISLNPGLLNELKQDYIDEVVVHETAHSIVHHIYGNDYRVKPHGREFKAIARANGISGKATTRVASNSKSLKTSGTRNTNRHTYSCGCQEHLISTVRANKILRGTASYSCRSCGEKLVKGKLKVTV